MADQPLYQQRAPVPSRPSPRAQKANHKGIDSRHILASTHESRCTANGKFKYMKNDPLRRQIRRDLTREGLILNHARTKKTATQLFGGLANLCRGAYDVAVGGVGLPWTLCSETISFYRANRRLNTVCRSIAGLGCGLDGRLMYGLQYRVLKPLSISLYKAEHLRSYQTWADSDEASYFSIRTRNPMAECRAANLQECRETIEGKRVTAKESDSRKLQQSQPATSLRNCCKKKAIPGPRERWHTRKLCKCCAPERVGGIRGDFDVPY